MDNEHLIFNTLKNLDFLKDTDDAYIKKLTKELMEVSFEANECILKEGRRGGSFFFLLKGTISIWISLDNGDLIKIAQLSAPAYFGELALIHDLNRTATIKTETEVKACSLSKEAFKELILSNDDIREKLIKYTSERTPSYRAESGKLNKPQGFKIDEI